MLREQKKNFLFFFKRTYSLWQWKPCLWRNNGKGVAVFLYHVLFSNSSCNWLQYITKMNWCVFISWRRHLKFGILVNSLHDLSGSGMEIFPTKTPHFAKKPPPCRLHWGSISLSPYNLRSICLTWNGKPKQRAALFSQTLLLFKRKTAFSNPSHHIDLKNRRSFVSWWVLPSTS